MAILALSYRKSCINMAGIAFLGHLYTCFFCFQEEEIERYYFPERRGFRVFGDPLERKRERDEENRRQEDLRRAMEEEREAQRAQREEERALEASARDDEL